MRNVPSGPAVSLPAQTPALPASAFHCDLCQKPARFLSPSRAAVLAAVSRSTIYYWMRHGWVHWRLLPSQRRVICMESLSRASALGVQAERSPQGTAA